MPTASRHAEVWGSPIQHSLSPVLHRAAYDTLGVDWSYNRREVGEQDFSAVWELESPLLSGLSVTMPLKERLVDVIPDRDSVVNSLGVANTAYRTSDGWAVTNTDPWGVVGALDEEGVHPKQVLILGAGATARAVGYGVSLLGVSRVELLVRNRERAHTTEAILGELGVEVTVLTDPNSVDLRSDLVVSTLPGGVDSQLSLPPALIHTAALFDVSYSPWPSAVAQLWAEGASPVISGVSLLLHQALRQIRYFLHASGEEALDREATVLAAMKNAVGYQSGPSGQLHMGE